MADEGLLIEGKKKTKKTRPKSAKTTENGIPLADMAGTSKINQLLQDAVSQSVVEAKSQKKKKKKDVTSADSVLESIRKGEGLQKESDATVIANTYDPSSPKYEKSNKKKQKLREEQFKKNELEIIDETLGKAKKKKKPKADEKIENYDISHLADKTMTLSELDVSKTPGKKKKKKPETEHQGSARSEEEPSVSEPLTTPKKKKKKPPGGEPVQEIIEPVQAQETSTAPVKTAKKKKKKPVSEDLEPDKSKSEEVVISPKSEEVVMTPKKKKKVKPEGGETEDEALSPTEDVVSPKGKKKKKKTEGGETEDEALSPTENVVSPKGKKKKKKTGEPEDERPLSPEPVTTPTKGKKKKKKGEGETEEEALSPTEDLPSPKPRAKKKKKKPEGEGKEEEETKEETEPKTEEEPPKPKPRRKKKKETEEGKTEEEKTEEPAKQEEEVSEPSGMDVEDDGRIMAITIHRTDKLKNDFFIMHPMVRVHIVDQETGKYLVKQHKDRAVTTYFEMQNQKVTQVLPIMTKPFDFKQQRSVLPVWEELLIFNENYNYFIQEKPKVIIFFELLDFVSMNRAAQNDGHDKGWHRIAWAFLKVVGNNKKINTGSKVRLQLFEPPSGIRRNPELVEVFQWWQSGSRKPYASTLYVTLKGITPPESVEPAERSLFATQAEKGKMTYEDLKKSINWGGKKETMQRTMASWSRLAGQSCRLPNILTNALPTAKQGCFLVKFSHDGRNLACACHGREGYPILVYEIPSGKLKGKFLGHFGIVYDISWSKMDTHLLSASSDGTARVWNLNDFGEQAEKLLPHPTFVYCAQFHPRVDSIVVTGGFDQVIRVWDIGGPEPHGDLRQELEDHIGYVNSLCFSDDGQYMYSADSIGVILVWNSFFTELPSKRGIARDWTLFAKYEDPKIKGTAINFITLHPSGRRLLVHCRDNIIRMLDLRVQRVLQEYIGALNFREQIRSCITPCGSFVFSGSEDNNAYAWSTDTGDQVVMYSDLKYQNPVTGVDYHPRDHMIAFCSLGDNHPVLLYSYDARVAQFDAGLSPRQISPTPADEEKESSPRMVDEHSSKGVFTKEEFQLHTSQRYEKVMRTLNKVTSQMTATSAMLDLPGMTMTSPRLGRTGMMTMSTGYDMTPRSLMVSPTAFSPHAQRSMASVMQQQQFASQNLYMKGADSWRPTFSEVGRSGALRSTSPVLGRAPQLNLTASQGKAQFNFQAPPGKAIPKYDKVVALYDYRAQRSDELNLFAGDVISVLYKDNDNWWMGELQDGQQGFFPSNYATEEESLMDSHRNNLIQDDSDTESKNLTAVKTKSGELKFISGAEDSEDDLLEPNRMRRKKRQSPQDSASESGKSDMAKKPPRKAGQKVRISENSESHA